MNCSNLTAENGVKVFDHQAVILPLFSFLSFFTFYNAASLPRLHCAYKATECECNILKACNITKQKNLYTL